jgi:hypothetical protein
MDSLVIGYGHRTRHGKDTAVAAIVSARGKQNGGEYDVRRYAFADLLKREANAAAEQAGGMYSLIENLRAKGAVPEWVQYDPSPDMSDPHCPLGKQRTLLQWWGTEFRRAKDPYYWVKAMQKTLERERPQVALISDMRFKNEFNWIVDVCDGRTVWVERSGYVGENPSHPSEVDLDDYHDKFDHHIYAGEGEVEHLKQCAVESFDMIVDSFKVPDYYLEPWLVPADEDTNVAAV